MTRTHEKVGNLPEGKNSHLTPVSAASGVERVLRILEGRWKLVILFHLFGGKVLRFSDLERAIPAISQKMLIQQLRQMEKDGVVRRIRSEEHTSELQSLMRISYAVFCLKKKKSHMYYHNIKKKYKQ